MALIAWRTRKVLFTLVGGMTTLYGRCRPWDRSSEDGLRRTPAAHSPGWTWFLRRAGARGSPTRSTSRPSSVTTRSSSPSTPTAIWWPSMGRDPLPPSTTPSKKNMTRCHRKALSCERAGELLRRLRHSPLGLSCLPLEGGEYALIGVTVERVYCAST